MACPPTSETNDLFWKGCDLSAWVRWSCWGFPVVVGGVVLVVVAVYIGVVVGSAVCLATVPSALDESVTELVLSVGSSGPFGPGAPPVSG